MSNPISETISFISATVFVKGWRDPSFAFLPGNVISIVSFFSLSCFAISFNVLNFSSNLSCRTTFNSFVTLPNSALFSAAISAIPFIMAVNSPFLPKTFTLRSFSSSRFPTLLSFSSTSSLKRDSFSNTSSLKRDSFSNIFPP